MKNNFSIIRGRNYFWRIFKEDENSIHIMMTQCPDIESLKPIVIYFDEYENWKDWIKKTESKEEKNSILEIIFALISSQIVFCILSVIVLIIYWVNPNESVEISLLTTIYYTIALTSFSFFKFYLKNYEK